MRGRFVAKRAWLWAGLGIALGLGIVLYTGRPWEARATEGPESEYQTRETIASARALVAKLEAQLHLTESSLEKARELLAKLEGVTNLKNATGNDLVGFWRLVGERTGGGDEFHRPPYVLYRIMLPDRFLNIDFDPNTGKVLDWTGGSYSLKDGTYTGHYDYSNSEAVRAIIGKGYKFTSKIEGDRWYHAGTIPNGVRFDDLYERVKKPEQATLEGEGPHRQPALGRFGDLRNAEEGDLVGIWRLVGQRKGEGGEFHTPRYETYRLTTPNRFLLISFDPKTGKDFQWAGGTYSIKNGVDTGRFECSTREESRDLVGKEFTFTSTIEGDRLWHFAGTLPNGWRLDLLWERINLPR